MRITVQVKPNSKKGPLVEEVPDGFIVYVREVAAEGKANNAVVDVIAHHYNVPKTRVRIIRGATSKYKTIEITEL